MGPRGDAILQADWSVGQILDALDRLGIADNTLVIFTSDNGPVIDDGYKDQAVELLGAHTPSGPFRGGKYSAFEAGTRVPFLLRWPARVSPATSNALLSQVDLMGSLASLAGAALEEGEGPDSFNELPALLDQDKKGRDYLIEHNAAGTLSIIQEGWKYIEPSIAQPYNALTNIELGNDPQPQLYHITSDAAEQQNVAEENPEKTQEMAKLLEEVKKKQKSRS